MLANNSSSSKRKLLTHVISLFHAVTNFATYFVTKILVIEHSLALSQPAIITPIWFQISYCLLLMIALVSVVEACWLAIVVVPKDSY